MPSYCDNVASAAVGGTADTFDNIGTVTLRANASRVLAILSAFGRTTSTTAEAHSGQMRVQSDDLGFGNQIIVVGPYVGGIAATNEQAAAHNVDYRPLFWEPEGEARAGNARVVVDYSTNLPDPTGASEGSASVLYEAGGAIPEDIIQTWPKLFYKTAGYDTEANGSVTTTAATAITDLEIPAWADAITGFLPLLVNDANTTAGEAASGLISCTSSIPDWTPQEYPFHGTYSATLGTPADALTSLDLVDYLPLFFQTPKVNATITPSIALNVALTAGASAIASVAWM